MKNKFCIIALSSVAIFCGCVTVTGPSISDFEIKQATEELKVKALIYRIGQLEKTQEIADHLMRSIPPEDITIKNSPQAFLGLRCFDIDRYLKQVYDLTQDRGVVVVIVRKRSPADYAGLRPGDIVLSVNDTRIHNNNQFYGILKKLNIADSVRMQLLRGDDIIFVDMMMVSIPINTPVFMFDMQEVNAATDGESLFVTQGLLNFAKSDDEIASVLAHELAHAARGHVPKMQGGQLLGSLLTLTLGIVAEQNAPGSGEIVMRGVGTAANLFTANYSRDFEREADYFGARLVYSAGYDVDVFATFMERFAIEIPDSMVSTYFSTHPSSSERMLRLQKISEELKSGLQGYDAQ